MEKLSGLVLDVYDDTDGSILQEIFPGPVDLSELEKSAHALTVEEHSALPDDAYALVLVNGDQVMKKFATVDAGNTALSVMYFLKTAHKLPEEAQKVAAQNLTAACGWYGLVAPDLLKVSLDLHKQKTNLDKAPDRPQKFPTHGDCCEKAGLDKVALGLMGAAMGALTIPQYAREAKGSLAATKGARGAVLTPAQVKQRKAQMGMF